MLEWPLDAFGKGFFQGIQSLSLIFGVETSLNIEMIRDDFYKEMVDITDKETTTP